MATNVTYIPRGSTTPTQRRILQCVVEALAEAGYAQTTIAKIGKRLGISKGVIQYHFPSKEELIQEVIAYIYAAAQNYMSSQIWNTTDEWEQIRSFIEVSCKFYQQYPAHIKSLQAIRANFQPKKYVSLAQTLYEQELSDLAKVFVSGQRNEVFREFDPIIAALTLRLALNGVAINLYSQTNYDAQKHSRELVEIFRRAFLQKYF